MWQKYINTDIKETYNQAEHQISLSNTADTTTLCDADWLVCAAQHLQRDQQITQKMQNSYTSYRQRCHNFIHAQTKIL